jgi:hypothetical protein
MAAPSVAKLAEGWCEMKLSALGGLIPAALGGAFGKENRGFGLGIVPGLLYKDKYKRDEEEKEEKKRQAAGAKSPDEAKVIGMKKGGSVKSSASKRADGIATKGKTRGRMV